MDKKIESRVVITTIIVVVGFYIISIISSYL